MTAEITTAREAMAVAIASDQDIGTLLAGKLDGATLKVFRERSQNGVDGAKHCPCVVLGPSTMSETGGDKHSVEYSIPMGVYLNIKSEPEQGVDNVVRDDGGAVAAEILELAEKAASSALLSAGFPYEQVPYMPEDVEWSRFHMAFVLYRINVRRIIA